MTPARPSWRLQASLVAALAALPTSPAHAATYTYKDESGTFHMVTEPNQVPERFRANAKRYDDEPAPKRPASAPAARPPDASGTDSAPPPSKPASTPIVLQSVDPASDHIVVDATFDGSATQRMIVDTGATLTNISSATARRLGVSSTTPFSFIAAETANGTTILPVIRARSVTVGTARVEDMPVVVNDAMSEGLLGVDFLGNFTYQVDAAMQTLTLSAFDATPRSGIYGGHPVIWWNTRYATYRKQAARIRRVRDAAAKGLSSSSAVHWVGPGGQKAPSAKEVAAALDTAASFWDKEARDLAIAASAAGVPGGLHE